VLNEVEGEHEMTPERYTQLYDVIVWAIREVSPKTKFAGMALGLLSFEPGFFEYFLNPKNHRPGIPLDIIAYHFYAGYFAGSSKKETIPFACRHWRSPSSHLGKIERGSLSDIRNRTARPGHGRPRPSRADARSLRSWS